MSTLHSSSFGPSARRPGRAFPLQQLPDDAQALIWSLAAKPSCPTHVLLSSVNKGLAKDALEHLAADAAGITLDLSCGQDSTIEQRMHEVQRLTGLSAWLCRHGPTLSKLAVKVPDLGEATQEYLLASAQGISGILAALAAAGTRPGGLPFKQLQLPVAGSTLPATVCGALSTCQQLKDLQLDYCCGGQAVRPACCLRGDLLKALQQMSQLTSLKVTVGGSSLSPQAPSGECLDAFYMALPSGLETLALSFSSYPPSILFYTQASSLQHLKALRRLALPDRTVVLVSPGHSLATLTALTCLVCERLLPGALHSALGRPQPAGDLDPLRRATRAGKAVQPHSAAQPGLCCAAEGRAGWPSCPDAAHAAHPGWAAGGGGRRAASSSCATGASTRGRGAGSSRGWGASSSRPSSTGPGRAGTSIRHAAHHLWRPGAGLFLLSPACAACKWSQACCRGWTWLP